MKNYQANQVQKDLFYSNQVDEMKKKTAAEQLAKKEKIAAEAQELPEEPTRSVASPAES